jgi:hypothetical protein
MIAATTLGSAALGVVLFAAPRVTLVPEFELGSGYDSNAFFDSSALPEETSGTAGVLLRTSPSLDVTLNFGVDQALQAGYAANVDQLVAGDLGDETILRHRGELRYFAPSVAQFKLSLGLDFQQLTYRTSGGAWIQFGGSLQLRRPLGSSLRLHLDYRPVRVLYEQGNVASEWMHVIGAGLTWSLTTGLHLFPTYDLTVAHSTPSNYDSLRHGFGLWLGWVAAALPLQLAAGYRASLSRFGQLSANPEAPLEDQVARHDLIHQLCASLRVYLHDWIYAYAQYDGMIGHSNDALVTYNDRHVGVGGVGLVFSTDLGSTSSEDQRPDPRVPTSASTTTSGQLRVAIEAPAARRVAVIGTFNDWDARRAPLSRRNDGRWAGRLDLEAGSYRYMLWIDGDVVAPPACDRWAPDGFGGKNCVIEVTKQDNRIHDEDGSQKGAR